MTRPPSRLVRTPQMARVSSISSSEPREQSSSCSFYYGSWTPCGSSRLLCILCEDMWLLSGGAGPHRRGRQRGTTAIRAPRPIARYLLIITVSFEASLSTLVSRTPALCALHAELKMNVRFICCSPLVGAQYCRICRFRRRRSITRRLENTRKFASLPISASCGFEAGNIIVCHWHFAIAHCEYGALARAKPEYGARRPTGRKSEGNDATMTVGADR